jgi:hypothetical protein
MSLCDNYSLRNASSGDFVTVWTTVSFHKLRQLACHQAISPGCCIHKACNVLRQRVAGCEHTCTHLSPQPDSAWRNHVSLTVWPFNFLCHQSEYPNMDKGTDGWFYFQEGSILILPSQATCKGHRHSWNIFHQTSLSPLHFPRLGKVKRESELLSCVC